MKSLLSLLEPEEFVGGLWHRLTDRISTPPGFAAAAEHLDSIQRPLTVLFRGLGGASGLRIAVAGETTRTGRGTFRQRIAGKARTIVARRDGQAIYLPPSIDAWPDRADNRALYIWLAAFFAHLPPRAPKPAGVARDISFLKDVRAAAQATLVAAPGLAAAHARLSAAILQARPRRS